MLIELSIQLLSDLVDNCITRRLVTMALLVVLFRALIFLVAKRSGFLLLCIDFRSSSKYWRVFSLVPLKFPGCSSVGYYRTSIFYFLKALIL